MFHPQGPTFWELAQQALSATARGYDLLAPKFDYTPFRTPDVVLDRVGTYLKEFGPFACGLDLCCGTGAGLRLLRPLCQQRVVGLDFSQGMLAQARRQSPHWPGTAAVDLVCADALALPFAACFDVVVSFGALGHFLPRQHSCLLRQVYRALRPGGHFLFLTAPRPASWSPACWLARAFNAAMQVRNFLFSPPFIMYYLLFPLPRACRLLRAQGFEVTVRLAGLPSPWHTCHLVHARRRPHPCA
jgi:SAM-dependent methyltransferase